MLKARLVPISFLSLQIEKSKILKKNVSYITLQVSHDVLSPHSIRLFREWRTHYRISSSLRIVRRVMKYVLSVVSTLLQLLGFQGSL